MRRHRRGSALRRRYGHATRGNREPRLRLQIERLNDLITHAMLRANKRGYTGMVGSKGGFMEDPDVKRLMKRRDALLKRL